MTQSPILPARPACLQDEYHVLLRQYAEVQTRCSLQIAAQAQEIESLRAELMRVRAQVIERETRLWLARETAARLARGATVSLRRSTLLRQVRRLTALVQDLIRERLNGQWRTQTTRAAPGEARAIRDLTHGLAAAQLVICQTGCLSHRDYWRVKDVCKRTGKTCVLVTDPEALRRAGLGAAGRADVQQPPARQGADG